MDGIFLSLVLFRIENELHSEQIMTQIQSLAVIFTDLSNEATITLYHIDTFNIDSDIPKNDSHHS